MKRSNGGEYEDADRTISRNHSRAQFLYAVAKCKPKVWDDLLKGEAGRFYGEFLKREEMVLHYNQLKASPSTLPLAQALDEWGKKWHLEDEWCKEQALTFIELSHYREEEGEEGGWSFPSCPLASSEERFFSFEYEFSDATEKTIEELIEEIRCEFESELGLYKDYIQAIAKERGYVPARKAANTSHLEILASHQVSGGSRAKISAEFDGLHEGTISSVTTKTAEFIGLKKRKTQGKRGPDKDPRSKRSKSV